MVSRGRAATAGLFDRDHQPSDQTRDFVQMIGIMRSDGACQTSDAFVVAEVGKVDRQRREHRDCVIDLDEIRHRIASMEPRDHQL
jgi:hypothetical protein